MHATTVQGKDKFQRLDFFFLPLLNWETPEEAKAAWLGFLAGAPRLHPPLLSAIKPHFLETAQHYAELGTVQQRFLSFFTWAALHLSDGYTLDDFQESWHKLPPSALEGAALALSRSLNNTSEPREAFWKNRVQPLWHKCWPKFEDAKAPQLAGQLIRMALAARGEFPSVVKTVEHWLVPIQYPDFEMQLLLDSQLCQRFPDEALHVLSKVTPCPPQAPPSVLEDCLTAISQGKSELEQNTDYTRLRYYCRRQR